MNSGGSLAVQAERQWTMFRSTVGRFTEAQWQAGDSPGQVPARIALHALQWADFYIQDDPAAFEAKARFGVDDDHPDPAALPGREALLVYLDEVAGRTEAFLRGLDDAALHAPETRFPWTGATVLERALYTLRHTTYHLGELSFALRVHGADRTEWR